MDYHVCSILARFGENLLSTPSIKWKAVCATVLAAAVFVSIISRAPSAAAQAPSQTPPIFPLSDIKPGMKGVGRSVFVGSNVEEFQFEVLGVLKNVTPRQNVILARLSGGPLERTGVLAGMSGSPVYIDGRLVGAVALAFQFSKEPIAGITPIEQMLQAFVEDTPPPAAPGAKNVKSAWRFEPGTESGDGPRVVASGTPDFLPASTNSASPVFWEGRESALVPVATPLVLSGFTSEAIEQFQGAFRSLGMIPVQGGSMGTGADGWGDASRLKPGSMISVQLIRGDMNASADGTVTLVDKDHIYAFGHPFLAAGPTEIPFSESNVVTVLPSYSSAMKITTPGRLLGTIGQDRSSGISGILGRKARTIPVEMEVVSSRGSSRTYHFEMVNDRIMLPFLMNLTALSAIGSTERQVGDSTLQVEQTIAIDGLPEVKAESLFSGSSNIAVAAAQSAATPLAYLVQSGVGPLDIHNIHLKIVSTDRHVAKELEQLWASKREVRPGDTIELTALLRGQDGKETLQKQAVEIPANVTPGPLTIAVADGTSMDRAENGRPGKAFLPKDPQQLVRAINKSRRNNRLYVRLARSQTGFVLKGENFPSPPPSVVRTLAADPAVSTDISPTNLSTVAEYEMDPIGSVVTGYKTITVTVKD